MDLGAIGTVSFGGFLALFLRQWTKQGLTSAALLHGALWVMLFIFAYAFMGELHFRGLLLRPFESRLGTSGARC